MKINSFSLHKLNIYSNFFKIFFLLLFFYILHIIWSKNIPIADIESYYWDWSRDLSMSYHDHPGAVAWICRLGTFLTNDESNLRFFVPIFSLLTNIFLILSYCKINKIMAKKIEINKIILIIIFYNIIPVFSIQSFVLMPDFSLLTFLSLNLFLLLHIIDRIKDKNYLPIISTIFLGISAGMGANSKHHMLPIIFINLITLYCSKLLDNHFKKFLIIFSIFFFLTFFPTLYWNINNNYSSFIYQLDHGYGRSDFSIKNSFLFLIESSVYITPLFFTYGLKKIFTFSKNKDISSLEIKLQYLAIAPLCVLIIVFLFASFFDYVAPYWISPVFILLIPFYIDEIKLTTWHKYYHVIIACICLIPTVMSFKSFRNYFVHKTNGTVGYKIFFWDTLTKDKLEMLANIKLPKSLTFKQIQENGCNNNDSIIASFNWTWTSQLAYHLKDHPIIYNIDDEKKSFYTFRDDLKNLKNCNIILITNNDKMEDLLHYLEQIKYLKVINIKEFSTKEEFHSINIASGKYFHIPKNEEEIIDNY